MQESGLKSRIARNVFSNWTGFAVTMVVTFFLSPFVVHTLGDARYGIWVLVGSLTGYMGLLDFGLRPAIVKYASRYQALADNKKINEIINTSLVVYGFIGILVIVAALIVAWFSPDIFKVPPESFHELRIAIILIGVNVAMGFPFGVFAAVINGFQRFDINNIIMIIVLIVRTALIVIFLNMGGGLIALAVIVTVAGVAEYLFKFIACRKIFPDITISLTLASRNTLKKLAGFSVYVLIIGVAGKMMLQSGSIIIGAFISAEAITFFAIAANLVQYWTQTVYTISTTATPVASSLEAQQDFDRLRRLLITGTRYSLLVILPIGYIFLFMGEQFINLWMGPEYGPLSIGVLLILTWSHFGYLSQFVTGSIFYGLGRIKLLAYVNIVMAVASIVISIVLVKPYGIAGVAWGMGIPLIFYGMILQPVYICRVLDVSLWVYFQKAYVPALTASLPFLVCIWAFNRFMHIDSLLTMGLYVALAGIPYVLIGAPIGVERDHLRSLIARIKGFTRTKTQ